MTRVLFGFLVWVCAATTASADPINVALGANGGTAAQSSTWMPGWTADLAIDGVVNQVLPMQHTNIEAGAWWEVTFDADYFITETTIHNRSASAVSDVDRINTFSVFLYDAIGEVVWSSLTNSIILPAIDATFSNIDGWGRRLRVQLDGTNYLHMREVEVWGWTEEPGDNGNGDGNGNGAGNGGTVPEPATLALLGAGLGLNALRRRRR